MNPPRATFDNLGGGLNEGERPHQIDDNQFVLLENFIPFAKRIIRRNGTYKKCLEVFSTYLTGLFIHRHTDGTPTPIFGTPQGFAWWKAGPGGDTGTIEAIPATPVGPTPDDVDSIPWSLKPWVFVQLQGIAYAMREQLGGPLLRVTPSGYSKAGIEAPPAPTIAINATGKMTAGDRTLRVTFRNSNTGAESDGSDESNTITLTAGDSVDVTDIAISANPQVNQRRLWINAPGTTGVWLLAGTVDDNATTTANINKAVSELGAAMSTRNGLPPSNLRVGDVFLDSYIVASDGLDVFISEPFRQESYSAFSVFNVFRGDGHAVTAIRAFKRQLLIGKTNKIHVFTKNGSAWSRDTLSEKHGCYSHHSMQVFENGVLWYGGDDFYMTDGNTVGGIGSTRVKKLLARIPAERKEFVSAVVYPKYGLYIAFAHVDPTYLADPTASIDEGGYSSPNVASNDNNVAIVYNYRTNAWSTWTWGSTFHAPFLAVFDHDLPNFEQALFGIFGDNAYYQLDRGRRDDRIGGKLSIVARFRTKAFRFGPGHGLLSAIHRVFLNITSAAGTITLRLYKDRESTAAKERTDLPLGDLDYNIVRDDKGFNMRTSQKGSLWQLELEYDDEEPIEVSSMSFETIPIAQRVRMR